jgi:hypothetical protein
VKVHSTSKDCGKLLLQIEEREAWDVTGLELDEYVDVAFWTEVISQHGAEERQAAHVVPPTKLTEQALVDGDPGGHALLILAAWLQVANGPQTVPKQLTRKEVWFEMRPAA